MKRIVQIKKAVARQFGKNHELEGLLHGNGRRPVKATSDIELIGIHKDIVVFSTLNTGLIVKSSGDRLLGVTF